MNGQQFFLCTICSSNLAGMIKHSGVPMCCCNHEMELLKAGQGDAPDQHGIKIVIDGNKILVSIEDDKGKAHPMERTHSIEWIYLHTQEHGQRKMLQPGKRPEAIFFLERVESAVLYVYCSMHGLWEKDIPSPATYETDQGYDR